jgi:hypothetical protein
MKKYLLMSVAAAFAVTPALAQTEMSPAKEATGNEAARHQNVIEGAKESSEPGMAAPGSASDETKKPNLTAPGSAQGDQNNLRDGAAMDEGRASVEPSSGDVKKQPNKSPEGTGSEGRDENRLPQ